MEIGNEIFYILLGIPIVYYGTKLWDKLHNKTADAIKNESQIINNQIESIAENHSDSQEHVNYLILLSLTYYAKGISFLIISVAIVLIYKLSFDNIPFYGIIVYYVIMSFTCLYCGWSFGRASKVTTMWTKAYQKYNAKRKVK